MGASQSVVPHGQQSLSNVFEKELALLSQVINSIISSENTFVNDEYNFLTEETCNQYTLVLQSQLQNHLRVNIEAIKDTVLLVPKTKRLTKGAHAVDKDELCETIAQHYIRVLYLLCLIKYVYNLENYGDYSIAGILKRNIRLTGSLLEVHYCSIAQKDYDRKDKKVDFTDLKGLQFFVQHFLDKSEYSVFIQQLRRVVSRSMDADSVRKLACVDTLLTRRDQALLFGPGASCKKSTSSAASDVAEGDGRDMGVSIAPFNAIFASSTCMSKKKVVMQLGGDAASKNVRKAYETLKTNYVKNINDITDLVLKLVKKQTSSNGYDLRSISNDDLQVIVKDVKSVIARFYLGSIMDYQRLLDTVNAHSDVHVAVNAPVV